MSTTTTNLELVKPAGNERVDVDVINSNYDKIDEFAGLAITDADYVHTDNNYTTTEKDKLSAIQPNATATSFTQTLVSGTAVGTITINGTAYTIYAPAASGGASALNDLSDVTLATGKWENANESGGGGGYIPTGEVYTFFTDGSMAAANYTLYVQWTDGETVTTALIVSYSELISGWTTDDYQNVTINWDSSNQNFNFVAKSGSFECNGTYFDEGDTMGTLSSGNITFNAMEKEATGVDWTQVQLSGTKIAEIEIDGASQNVYAPTPPTKTSDLTNDSNFVADASYVHTDNNYTATEKNKLSGLVAVEANPSGTASTDLTKIAIGGTNYNIPSGGSGSSTFAGLSDVDIDDTTLANGQVPVWNSTTEKWENTFVSGGPTEFIETLDVGGQWVTYTYDLTDAYMVKIECDGDSYFIAPTDIAVYSLYTTLFTKDNVNFNIARSADYQTLYVSFSVPTSLTADIYAMTRGGGGTTVIANPTGTPTGELLAIQIGSDIYSLPEGESEHLLNDILTGPDATKATASSTSQDGAIWKAFDGVKTGTEQSCWIPEYGSTNCWICYHFAAPKYITKCHVYFYENMNGTYTGAVKIQGSNDGETWTDISESQALSMTRGVHDYEIESTDIVNGYSYVRMFSETALVVYGSASACTLELEIYGRDHASGTTVIPNPEGEATVELEKIQIGETIYSLPTSSDEGGYLTADGNCYSTLPVYSDENDILKIQFKFWSSDAAADNQTIIGSSFAGNSDYLLYMTVENGEPIYSYAVANNYTYIKAPRSTEDYDDIELGYDYMIVNGTTYTSQAPAKHSVHRPICVFGSNYRGSGTIGEIKIYKNNVLTYDLVPSLWAGNAGRFIDVLNDDTPYPSEGTSDYGYIGTSSGTTVIANPEGEATDTLTKIQIGDDIYEIPQGGGGGVIGEKDILWEYSDSYDITLAHPFTDYDFLVFEGDNYTDNNHKGGAIVSSMELESIRGVSGKQYSFAGVTTEGFANYLVSSTTSITYDSGSARVLRVWGIKFTSGEGSAEWTDVVGTLEAGQTQIVLTSSKINSNSVVNPYASKVGVKASDMVIANGSVTLTFPVQTEDLDVMVRVTKVDTNHTYDIDLSHLQTDKSWFYYDSSKTTVVDTGEGLQIAGNDNDNSWTTSGSVGINISNMIGIIPPTLSAIRLHFTTFAMSGYTGIRFINTDTLFSGTTGGRDTILRAQGFYQFENNNSSIEEEDYTLEIPCTATNFTDTYFYIMFFDGMITGNMSNYSNSLNGAYNIIIDGIDFVTGGDS